MKQGETFMPTKSQLFKLWETAFEFGHETASGYGSEHNAIADREKTPSSGPLNMVFTGKEIGDLVRDEKTGDLKTVPSKNEKPAP
jgi:hypothetical protein